MIKEKRFKTLKGQLMLNAVYLINKYCFLRIELAV